MAISLTYTFTAGTLAQAAHVNANFSTLATRALDKTGDTMTGSLLFTDATYDIGASGATRPRDFFLSRNAVIGGTLAVTGAPTFTVPIPIASGGIGAATATANLVFAGPTSGGAAAPSFRTLVSADFQAVSNLGVGAYNNTTQNLNDNTATALTFNAEDFDTGALHDNSTNPTRFTIPTGEGGVYHFDATCTFDPGATGFRWMWLRKNGTTVVSGTSSQAGHTTFQNNVMLSATVTLAAADYIEVMAQQTSSGTLATGHAATRQFQNSCQVVKVK